jgi:3D (Asp-Asp-Asp) domain-containing protein/septal ring factor EnvC (AmiA/AmiB activator)
LPPWKRVTPLLGLLGVAVLLALPTGGLAENPDVLRARAAELDAAEQSARVELFALESNLTRAQTALAGVEAQLTAVERARASSKRQLGAARKTLAAAEEELADQVRTLYLQEQPDVLELFLTASSIEDAIASIDALERSADATTGVVDQARAARARVARLLHTLTARREELRGLRAAAAAKTQELESARTERIAYIEGLRAQQVLTEQQIAEAVAAAEAAQAAATLETAKAQAAPSISSIGAQTVVSAPAPPPPPQPQPSPQAPVASGRTLTVVATAYTTRGTTATGIPAGPGVVAVDPSVIPLGSRLTIPGYGEGVAADTGGAIQGLRIDLWVATAAEAAQWQWKTVTIKVH